MSSLGNCFDCGSPILSESGCYDEGCMEERGYLKPSPPERLEGKGEKCCQFGNFNDGHHCAKQTEFLNQVSSDYAKSMKTSQAPVQEKGENMLTTQGFGPRVMSPYEYEMRERAFKAARELTDLKAQLASTEVGHLALIEGQQEMIEKLNAQLINEQCEHAKTKGMFEATVIVMNGKAGQVTQLTQKLAVVEKENEECGQTFKKLMDANDKLQADNARLKEALDDLLCEISDPACTDERMNYEERQVTKGAVERAREALATLSGNEKGN